MRQTEGVAILATQLAGSDRRALSQAWYSALHLAQTEPVHGAHPAMRAAIAETRTPRAIAVTAHAAPVAANTPTVMPQVRRLSASPPDAGVAERRAVRTRFERSLERAVSRRVDRGACGSFALAAEHGRVQILVRTERGTTRVVALCAPSLRERVERALAHVRFAVTTRNAAPGARP